MFCPICKTEYRPGFTKCSDCGVDLVAHIPESEPAADANTNADVPTDSEGRELLWSGLSVHFYNALREALDSAGISHNDVDKEFGILPTFAQEAFLIWIEPRDRGAARSVLDKVLSSPDAVEQEDNEQFSTDSAKVNPFGLGRRIYNRAAGQETTESEDALSESDAPSEPVPDDIVEDFDPDDATAEVWSGDDQEMAEYLQTCLAGVGIGCVLHEDGGKTRALVLPASETRAREIVREIVEATPPQ